jgi:hypothetical protein
MIPERHCPNCGTLMKPADQSPCAKYAFSRTITTSSSANNPFSTANAFSPVYPSAAVPDDNTATTIAGSRGHRGQIDFVTYKCGNCGMEEFIRI